MPHHATQIVTVCELERIDGRVGCLDEFVRLQGDLRAASRRRDMSHHPRNVAPRRSSPAVRLR
jgi:hypothetical protein